MNGRRAPQGRIRTMLSTGTEIHDQLELHLYGISRGLEFDHKRLFNFPVNSILRRQLFCRRICRLLPVAVAFVFCIS